jgi:citrate lyase subunit beta/citryl-CoA lyase
VQALPPLYADTGPIRSALHRSRLYLPGNEPRYMINAGLHRPDAVVLDLEDSVPPEEKDAALLVVRNALRVLDFGAAQRTVRVNAGAPGLAEIQQLLPHGVDAFVLPKVEHAATVRQAAELLEGAAAVRLIPIVESARGVANVHAIAAASPRVVALAIGLEDYSADIGAELTDSGRESLWALSQVVNAARAAGVEPLASVYSAIDDEAGFRSWLAGMRGLGFAGAACLHPRQIRAAHAAWTPSACDVASARRIVAGWEAARADGRAVLNVDGRMVDAPVVERARRVLALAEASE